MKLLGVLDCVQVATVLLELDITDLAIAENVRVQFAPGLNAITGETGAGKSIIIDAVGLLLGGKADAGVVRAGAPAARIEGIFEFAAGSPPSAVAAVLAGAGIESEDGLLIVSREVQAGGKGRANARINGRPVVQSTLVSIGRQLVDIHGQTDHASLLQAAEHVHYLDRYAGVATLRRAFAEQVQQLRLLRGELSKLRTDERERLRRQDRLRFECSEIETAGLSPGEEEELRAERSLLASAEQLTELADVAYAALMGGGRNAAAVDALGRTSDALQQLAAVDPRQAEDAIAAAALQEQANDLARSLRSYRDNIEYSPARLAAIEERLALLIALKRKYGTSVADVIAYGEESRRELEQLESGEERREGLVREEVRLLGELGERALALSHEREAAARRLATAIEGQLGELRMSGSRFAVRFTRHRDPSGVAAPLAECTTIAAEPVEQSCPTTAPLSFDLSGVDRVEFLVTLNPGEPLRPLARVASGGETSRLMLALKSVLGDADAVPTMVFDEIEAGLGGRSGSVVGDKLVALAGHHQVICITHLAQIAARSERHLTVAKAVDDGRTRATVREVTGEERTRELAAMLGSVTPATMATARELLHGDETGKGKAAAHAS